MASALALRHSSPRLRSRRLRSDRSHRLSFGFALAVIAFVGLVWYALDTFGSNGRFENAAAVDVVAARQQQFLVDLQPIHAEVQQSVEQEGLLVARYQNGELDRLQLQERLGDVLATYRQAALLLEGLQASPTQSGVRQSYLDAVRALDASTAELSRAYDDGDQGRVAAALAQSLQAMAKLHTATELTRPARD